jgi:DNA-binding NarL/FixJ family response regulator
VSSKSGYERRIVRRTRLLEVLQKTETRTVVLVAPAGYGKTTLARQWLEQVGGAWVTVTPASVDVPVLARDLASAIGSLTEFDSTRVEIALSASRTPADQAAAAARTILAQIRDPIAQWIVIDDYHLLGQPSSAGDLFAELESSGKFRFLATSRERPLWQTPRRKVYMETLEFGVEELALDEDEVSQLLPPDRHTVGLRRQARGWPAVIGLAVHSRLSDVPLSAETLSATLYDYFADELFERSAPEVQRALASVAALPPLEASELADVLSLSAAGDRIVATGLAYQSNGCIEVHPLARMFLLAKLKERGDALSIAETAFNIALDRGLYDQAFELIKEFELKGCLERLIVASYLALVETGRIATLQRFVRSAGTHGVVQTPILDLVNADIAFLRGDWERAHALANSAATGLSRTHPLKARCYLVAGRAAHSLRRCSEALELHSVARGLATTPGEIADSLWGVFLALVILEDDRTEEALRALESLPHMRASDRLRVDTGRAQRAFGLGIGSLASEDSDAAALLPQVTDPVVRSGWAYIRGTVLVLRGRYADAAALLRTTLAEIGEFGLAFGAPHVEWALAAAELGLRHFARSDALLRKIERNPNYDLHAELNVRSLRARTHLAQQRPDDAVAVVSDDFGVPKGHDDDRVGRAMYGEYLATRAIALAAIGDTAAALQTADQAQATTRAVDTDVLCAGSRALTAVGDRSGPKSAVEALLDTASRRDAWDGVVCAARASPALLSEMVLLPSHKAKLREVLLRSNDVSLARAVGLVTPSTGVSDVLSRREREILEHVKQGKKNAEIAASLFIARGTVKRHLDHIYDKLGTRSRAGAIARYAEIEMAETVDSSGSKELAGDGG